MTHITRSSSADWMHVDGTGKFHWGSEKATQPLDQHIHPLAQIPGKHAVVRTTKGAALIEKTGDGSDTIRLVCKGDVTAAGLSHGHLYLLITSPQEPALYQINIWDLRKVSSTNSPVANVVRLATHTNVNGRLQSVNYTKATLWGTSSHNLIQLRNTTVDGRRQALEVALNAPVWWVPPTPCSHLWLPVTGDQYAAIQFSAFQMNDTKLSWDPCFKNGHPFKMTVKLDMTDLRVKYQLPNFTKSNHALVGGFHNCIRVWHLPSGQKIKDITPPAQFKGTTPSVVASADFIFAGYQTKDQQDTTMQIFSYPLPRG